MAEKPDVLKRLRMIENALPFGVCEEAQPDLRWLLSLTRALLESQEQVNKSFDVAIRIIEDWGGPTTTTKTMREIHSRGEKVRRGDGEDSYPKPVLKLGHIFCSNPKWTDVCYYRERHMAPICGVCYYRERHMAPICGQPREAH